MSYYEHGVMIALGLGRWGDDRPHKPHRQEAEDQQEVRERAAPTQQNPTSGEWPQRRAPGLYAGVARRLASLVTRTARR